MASAAAAGRRAGRRLRILAAFTVFVSLSPDLTAQSVTHAVSGVARPAGEVIDTARSSANRTSRARHPLVVTLASGLVPGAGQIMMRQRRAIGYLALETIGIAVYVSQ